MAIDYTHKDYSANIDDWRMIENVCSGKDVEQYLIELNPSDTSTENQTRNKQYRERAVLYSVCGHTLQGLVGLLFSKYPQITLPAQLDYMTVNADGGGTSLYQQAQKVAADVIQKGRAGLYTSYPKTVGPVSVAQMAAGGYVATIHDIAAEQIINVRTETKGSKTFLSLVVIREFVEEVQADGYEIKKVEQLRELALVEGVFLVREWRKDAKDVWIIHDESIPTDSAGKTWDEIPFMFVGSLSNTPAVDDAPMYPLAKINIAHYRNSADYEDNVWYCGQAQPWMSGVTQNHLDMMIANNMYVGSRVMMGVPTGETFNFASAPPNTMVKDAMDSKLDMMIGLGARFIQGSGPAKTATEAGNDAAVQHSVLALVSSNVSEAYTQSLKWAGRYMGADGEVIFQTNMQFVSPTATSQDIQAMVAGFVQGAIPVGDYFRWLKKVDLVDSEKTLDEFSMEIEKVSMPDLDAPAPAQNAVQPDANGQPANQQPIMDMQAIVDAIKAIPAPIVNVDPVINVAAPDMGSIADAIKAIPAPIINIAPPVVSEPAQQIQPIILNTGGGSKTITINKNSDGSMTATSTDQ